LRKRLRELRVEAVCGAGRGMKASFGISVTRLRVPGPSPLISVTCVISQVSLASFSAGMSTLASVFGVHSAPAASRQSDTWAETACERP